MPKKKQQPPTPDPMEYQGDTWPEGMEHWTHEDYVAYTKAMFEEDAKYIPTPEEREVARHLRDKMESASSMNQRDPNA